MGRILSIHSFRGGTGKSNTSANLAAVYALQGERVGVVDTDIQSPGIHVLFGVDEVGGHPTLNDYLYGSCEIEACALDVSGAVGAQGGVFLIPSSVKPGEIAQVLRQGYDVGLLNDGFQRLIETLALDVLIIDTHPGMNEETLLSIAISDALAVVMRPDKQDYQGTGVTVDVARQLGVPCLKIVINKMPPSLDASRLAAQVAATYGCDVAGVVPHSDDLMELASSGVFVAQHPDHPVADRYRQIADALRP